MPKKSFFINFSYFLPEDWLILGRSCFQDILNIRSTILDIEMQNYGIFHGEAVAQIQISKELEPI